MAQLHRIGTHATTVATEDGVTRVTYHATTVVKVDRPKQVVTLNSGGWKTVTTKARINQAANELGLGFHVFQKDFVWYVHVGGYEGGKNYEFRDGIKIHFNGDVECGG